MTAWETVSAIVWETVCQTVWEIAWEIAQVAWVTGTDAREIGPGNPRTLGEDKIAAEAALAAPLLAALHHQDGVPLPGEALRPDLPLPVAMSDLRELDPPLGATLKYGEDLGHHLIETEEFAGIAHH